MTLLNRLDLRNSRTDFSGQDFFDLDLICQGFPATGFSSAGLPARVQKTSVQKTSVQKTRVTVQKIIADVRKRGDAALVEMARKFDRVDLREIQVPKDRIEAALADIQPETRAALELATTRIRDFHQTQVIASPTNIASPASIAGEARINSNTGINVTARHVPVQSAGLYAPGGRASYPSTVLMVAIPAQVAGVPKLSMCIPPGKDGEISATALAAAGIVGVDVVYRLGGAGAVAALAYGTETVEATDLIAGPGNLFVSLAQQEVSGHVGAPTAFAGPSEVAVIADATAPVDLVAADLLCQAEHGPSGRVWLISTDETMLLEAEAELQKQLEVSPRRKEIEATLTQGGFGVLVADLAQAVAVSDRLAPEHLQLLCEGAEALAETVLNAGAVFCGAFSPAVLGDYIAGPSHVLPTGGTARFAGALGVTDFQKTIHTITATREGFMSVADTVAKLAEVEGLTGHRDAVLARYSAGFDTDTQTEAQQPQPPLSQPPLSQPHIRALTGYYSPQTDAEVRLNTNESPLPPPAGFVTAVEESLRKTAWNRYPEMQASSLCEALARQHGLDPTQIFAANGSNEVIQTLLMCYAGQGRKVLVFEPGYALHSHIAKILGSNLITSSREQDFTLDVDKATSHIQRQRPHVVFLSSPNNPTGMAEPAGVIEAVLEATASVGGLLVLDEAYVEFAPNSAEGLLHRSVSGSVSGSGSGSGSASGSGKVSGNAASGNVASLAITRTYSKTWAMAAARLGYLMGPDWLVEELEKAALPYRLNGVSIALGVAALKFRQEMSERVAQVIAERDRICAEFTDMGVRFWPSDANFVLFNPLPEKVSSRDGGPASEPASKSASKSSTEPANGPAREPVSNSADATQNIAARNVATRNEAARNDTARDVWQALLDKSVLVRDCSSWPQLAGCLRVTVGTPDENTRFLQALREVIS